MQSNNDSLTGERDLLDVLKTLRSAIQELNANSRQDAMTSTDVIQSAPENLNLTRIAQTNQESPIQLSAVLKKLKTSLRHLASANQLSRPVNEATSEENSNPPLTSIDLPIAQETPRQFSDVLRSLRTSLQRMTLINRSASTDVPNYRYNLLDVTDSSLEDNLNLSTSTTPQFSEVIRKIRTTLNQLTSTTSRPLTQESSNQNLDLSQFLEDISNSSTAHTVLHATEPTQPPLEEALGLLTTQVDRSPPQQTSVREDTPNPLFYSTSTPTLSSIQERLPQINEEQEASPVIAVQPTSRLAVEHSSTISSNTLSSSQSNNSSASSNLIEPSDSMASRSDQVESQASRPLVVSQQRTSTIALQTDIPEEPTTITPVRLIPPNYSRPALPQRNPPITRLLATRQVNAPTIRSNSSAATTRQPNTSTIRSTIRATTRSNTLNTTRQAIVSTIRSNVTSTLRQANSSNARLTVTRSNGPTATANRIATTRPSPNNSTASTRRPLTTSTRQATTATVRPTLSAIRVPPTSTTTAVRSTATASRTSITRPQSSSVVTNTRVTRTNTAQSSPASQNASNSTLRLSKPPEMIGKRNDTISEKPHNLCDICFDNPKNSAFVPCGHVSCCSSCSERVSKERRRCIICNSFVATTLKIYIT